MLKHVCLFVLFITVAQCYQKSTASIVTTKPSWLVTCKRSSPDLNKCFTNMFGSIFAELVKGIPELNVESIEPLRVDKIPINKKTGAIRLTGSFQNYLIKGLKATTISDGSIDFDKKKFSITLNIPTIAASGVYDFKGQILVLPISGHGNSFIDVKGSINKIVISFELIDVDGVEVMRLTKVDNFSLERESVKIQLDNLFNGNKLLGDNANKFINENSKNVAKQVESVIVEGLAPTILDIANNVLEKIPTSLSLPQ